jgi:hypothetical protein
LSVSESLKAEMVHCWATVDKHVFDKAGLVAPELNSFPLTTDTHNTTDEQFKGVFCFQSAPSSVQFSPVSAVCVCVCVCVVD